MIAISNTCTSFPQSHHEASGLYIPVDLLGMQNVILGGLTANWPPSPTVSTAIKLFDMLSRDTPCIQRYFIQPEQPFWGWASKYWIRTHKHNILSWKSFWNSIIWNSNLLSGNVSISWPLELLSLLNRGDRLRHDHEVNGCIRSKSLGY